MFRFERLEVWQNAIDFADDVYQATGTFPGEERFGLTSQIRRAAVSISSNIAEGSGRSSNKEFARFIEFSYGSVMEVVSHQQIALRRSYIGDQTRNELYDLAERIARMLSGLRTSLTGPRPSTLSPRLGWRRRRRRGQKGSMETKRRGREPACSHCCPSLAKAGPPQRSRPRSANTSLRQRRCFCSRVSGPEVCRERKGSCPTLAGRGANGP